MKAIDWDVMHTIPFDSNYSVQDKNAYIKYEENLPICKPFIMTKKKIVRVRNISRKWTAITIKA